MFDNLKVFLMYFISKTRYRENSADDKNHEIFSNKQRVIKIENRFCSDERYIIMRKLIRIYHIDVTIIKIRYTSFCLRFHSLQLRQSFATQLSESSSYF